MTNDRARTQKRGRLATHQRTQVDVLASIFFMPRSIRSLLLHLLSLSLNFHFGHSLSLSPNVNFPFPPGDRGVPGEPEQHASPSCSPGPPARPPLLRPLNRLWWKRSCLNSHVLIILEANHYSVLSTSGPVPSSDPLVWVQQQNQLGTIPRNLDHPPRKDSMQTSPGHYTLIRWDCKQWCGI